MASSKEGWALYTISAFGGIGRHEFNQTALARLELRRQRIESAKYNTITEQLFEQLIKPMEKRGSPSSPTIEWVRVTDTDIKQFKTRVYSFT